MIRLLALMQGEVAVQAKRWAVALGPCVYVGVWTCMTDWSVKDLDLLQQQQLPGALQSASSSCF